MSNKTVAGFGDTGTNGIYVDTGQTRNGQTLYLKGDNYMLIYYEKYMPYSYAAGYYIIKTTRLPGSIAQAVPYYSVAGTDPTAAGWVTYRGKDSGEQQVGTVS